MPVDQQANKEGLLLLQTRISQTAMEQKGKSGSPHLLMPKNAMRKTLRDDKSLKVIAPCGRTHRAVSFANGVLQRAVRVTFR
ncbi:hypothetical protein [Paraburkholderia graminis]|jgi:hypothetical protein|uniref:hypothetical protein n=1 Tax=Paraburkholderia graminis TaxID=60548 RepID=UPI00278FB7FA|nr:hypothetical protein [Paraburkholderia graminis]MDQ0625479.1 hypothetical protein [Paraburkholderia graminis]